MKTRRIMKSVRAAGCGLAFVLAFVASGAFAGTLTVPTVTATTGSDTLASATDGDLSTFFSGADLPDGLLPTEYADGFGSAYVDLDIVPNGTDRIELDAALTTWADVSKVYGLFCSRNANNDDGTKMMCTIANGAFEGFLRDKTVHSEYKPAVFERFKVVLDGNRKQFLVNGSLKGWFDATSPVPTAKLRLFGLWSGSGVACLTDLRVYGFKVMSKEGVLRANLVPAAQVGTDGASAVSGLYDCVGEKFYASCTTENFGGPLRVLPPSFEELEYLEAQGDGAYLNLGLTPKCDDRIEAKIAFTDVTRDVQGIFCARKTSNDTRIFTCLYKDKVSCFYGTDRKDTSFPWKQNEPHVLYLNGASKTLSIDGTKVSDLADLFFWPDSPLFLYCLQSNGTPATFARMRVYSLNWWVSADTVRERLVPARRVTDGVLGLYDCGRKMFFTNAGDGSFVAGPRVTNRWAEEPSLSKTAWTTWDAPAVINLGSAAKGTVTCNMSDADIAALGVGTHEVTFSVAAGEDYAALSKTVAVTVTEPADPVVDKGDLVVKAVKNGQTVTGAQLTFPAANVERACVVVWGTRDFGVKASDWPNLQSVTNIPAGAVAQEIVLPESLARGAFRVFLAVRPTPRAYVQNGLVALYDAIDNAGFGRHDNLLANWTELKQRNGSLDMPMTSSDVVAANEVCLSGVAHQTLQNLATGAETAWTVEMNTKIDASASLKTLGFAVHVPNQGGLGWSGSERGGCVALLHRVGEKLRYSTFGSNGFPQFDDVKSTGRFLTYEGTWNADAMSFGLDGTALDEKPISAGTPYTDVDPGAGLFLQFGHDANPVKNHARSIRVYTRMLSAEEAETNRLVDAARFEDYPLNAAVSDAVRVGRGFCIIVR